MSLDLAFRLAMQDEEVAKSLGELVTKKKVLAVKGLEPNSLRKIAEIKADKVYEMLLEDNELAIFHFEVQGKSSHRDMALRMFDYITRIVSQTGDLNVCLYSVVIYLDGAGANDGGNWTFGNPVIGHFQYTPLRLWELDGDIFLDGDNINLLAFLPQMKLSRPQEQMQTAMQRIANSEDKDHAAHLLYILAALTQKKGLKPVVNLFMSKEMMLNAPDFIRDAYLEARDEGRKEGEAKGLQEGLQKGLQKGLQEGLQEGLRKGRKEGRREGRQEGEEKGMQQGFIEAKTESVLTLLRLRFEVKRFEEAAFTSIFSSMDRENLDIAFEKAATAQSLDDMRVWLDSLEV